MSLETRHLHPNTVLSTSPLHALLKVSRSLLANRIITGIMIGNVSAVNLLRDALRASRDLGINHILLALGPSSPLSFDVPPQAKVLWTTFLDDAEISNTKDLTIVPPNRLTDLSVSLDGHSSSDAGSIRLILGDFLDNVLSVSATEDVFVFLSKLFARIREKRQTAFLLANADMQEPRKIAMLKRFADIVIEYRCLQDDDDYLYDTRIFDNARDHYGEE